MKKYDLIVIGSGAGLMVVQAAVRKGLSCALVEEEKIGGTCLTRGCIPSKVLVHPADLIRETERAGAVGLTFSIDQIDWPRISERVWKKIDGSKRMEASLRDKESLDLYMGTARFLEDHIIGISMPDTSELIQIEGEKILLAAGGRSFVPPISGLEAAGYMTYETFFGDDYPEKPWPELIIVGGGPIGCEFAHVFSALGTKVTIVEMQARLAANEEPEVSQLLQEQMQRNGVEVLVSYKATSAAAAEGKKKLTVESAVSGESRTLSADAIFIASGIRSNADRLDVARAGIKTDNRGWIVTNAFMETSVPDIYALGDINGQFQFRHKANYEADILIHNLFSGSDERREAHYNTVPWAIFTHPQIAHVGMTEEQARQTGKRLKVGKNYYSMTANGYAMGYEPNDPDDGFVKLIADDSGKILGVHIIGPYASVLIQSFVYLMNAGFTCQDRKDKLPIPQQSGARFCLEADSIETIDQSMVIHPALSEVAAWVTEELEWVD